MESHLNRGKLIKWKDERGFGFIQPLNGTQEVFLHISELKEATRRPQVGDTIYYDSVLDRDNKIRACNAFILGARNPSAPSSRSKALPQYPFPLWELFLLSILPLGGSIQVVWTTANPIPLLLYPTMSLLTFSLYANDKSRVQRGDRRIPERTLHLCELAGGWLGGFVAQRRLRHKSIKRSYQMKFWMIVALHIILWLTWLFLGRTLIKIFLGI